MKNSFWRKSAKTMGLVLAVFLCYGCAARAQTDNMIHVKSFPGTDVGTKTANAMATCSSTLPCILVIDPSLASAPAGTLPSLCGNCYLWDWRTGTPTASGGYAGVVTNGASGLKVGGIVNQFQGCNWQFIGDSRTAIAGGHLSAGQEWPTQLASMSVVAGSGGTIYDDAISGTTAKQWASGAAGGNDYYATYAHAHSAAVTGKCTVAAVWLGVNDLSAGGETGAVTFGYLSNVWAQAKADGDIVVAMNECHGGTYAVNSANFLTLREDISSATAQYDYLFDVFLNFPDTSDSVYWNQVDNPVYHMTPVGANRLAFLVDNLLAARTAYTPMQSSVIPPLNCLYWTYPNLKYCLENISSAAELGIDNGTSTPPQFSIYGYLLDSTHYIRLRFVDSGSSWSIVDEADNETAIPLYLNGNGSPVYIDGNPNYVVGHLYPSVDGNDDAGSHTDRWRHVYIKDGVGTIALSSGTATVTFASAYGATPVCIPTDTTAANIVRVSAISTTAVTFTGTGTDTVAYVCVGN